MKNLPGQLPGRKPGANPNSRVFKGLPHTRQQPKRARRSRPVGGGAGAVGRRAGACVAHERGVVGGQAASRNAGGNSAGAAGAVSFAEAFLAAGVVSWCSWLLKSQQLRRKPGRGAGRPSQPRRAAAAAPGSRTATVLRLLKWQVCRCTRTPTEASGTSRARAKLRKRRRSGWGFISGTKVRAGQGRRGAGCGGGKCRIWG